MRTAKTLIRICYVSFNLLLLKCGTTLREQSFGFYGGVGVGDGEGWGDFFF